MLWWHLHCTTCDMRLPWITPGLLGLVGCVIGDDRAHLYGASSTEGIPACTSAATDPDGDGWGWEPAASCAVAGSGHAAPPCSAAASDPDGDGWGWEPAHSCKVGAAAPVAGGACTYASEPCGGGASCFVLGDDGTRATVKAEIWSEMYAINTQGQGGLDADQRAAREAEATCRADLAVAMAMQEANSFAVDGAGNLPHDDKKDGATDGSQNVCVFNLNIDYLRRSCRTDCGAFQDFANPTTKLYLDRRDALPECVRRLSEGFDHFGIEGTLYFHRGGASGWSAPGDDERRFSSAERSAAGYLRANPSARTDGQRVASDLPYR